MKKKKIIKIIGWVLLIILIAAFLMFVPMLFWIDEYKSTGE